MLKFVILIPSYKNQDWCEKNLASAAGQNYENYRIIYIDDASLDNTGTLVTNYIKDKQIGNIKLIQNTERQGALKNIYDAVHSCDDDEIIVTLDGDDWLAHPNVLSKLHTMYSDPNCWMTYGQYRSWPDMAIGCSMQIPNNVIDSNGYRGYRWCSSHLRTFYAWLFKKIKKEDLIDKDGKFYATAWDCIFQFPMLEMSGYRAKFIPDVLYMYNVSNPINDSKVNLKLQQDTERLARSKNKYQPL